MESTAAISLAILSGLERSVFSVSRIISSTSRSGTKNKKGGSSSKSSNSVSVSKTSFSARNALPVLPRSNFHSGTPCQGSSSQTPYEQIPNPSAIPQLNAEKIKVRISGRRNRISPKSDLGPCFSHVLCIPSDTPITELGKHLLKEQPGKPTLQSSFTNN